MIRIHGRKNGMGDNSKKRERERMLKTEVEILPVKIRYCKN